MHDPRRPGRPRPGRSPNLAQLRSPGATGPPPLCGR